MLCNTKRSHLEALADGELSLMNRIQISAHCMTCAACRQELAALRRIRSLSLSLPAAAMPDGAADRLVAALPDSVATVRKRRPRLAIALGVPVTIALVIGLAFLPHTRNEGSAVAAVRRALANVHTWHLKGWREIDGKQVPWEVWARRSPFFYREQMGDDVILDDGVTRTVVVGPMAHPYRKRRSEGFALSVPSTGDEQDVRWSYRRLVETWQGNHWAWGETEKGPIFNFLTVFAGSDQRPETAVHRLYFVNRDKWLPETFEVRNGPSNGGNHPIESAKTTAHLDIAYDEPIPAEAAIRPEAPSGYRVLNSAEAPSGLDPRLAATEQGFTLEVTPQVVYDDGSVAARVRAWIGRSKLDTMDSSPLHLAYTTVEGSDVRATRGGMSDLGGPGMRAVTVAEDDRGRRYVEAYWPGLHLTNGRREDPLVVFTPIEPITKDQCYARTLKVKLPLSLTIDTSFNDSNMDDEEPAMRLSSAPVTVSISISRDRQALEKSSNLLRMGLPTASPVREYAWDDNLPAKISDARALYYRAVVYGLRASRAPENKVSPVNERSLYWERRSAEISSSPFVQENRNMLAQKYIQMRRLDDARKVLQLVLDDRRFDALPAQQRSGMYGLDAEVAKARKALRQLDAR